MREKLNESQAAQVGLVAVLVVVALFVFLGKSGGGEEEPEAGPTVATVNGATASGDSPGEAVEAAISELEASGASASAGAMPASLPVPPPPAAFASAYDAGDTVVLLIFGKRGVADRRTARAAEVVAGIPGATLIRVPVKQLPRYASVTLGTAVNRVPALVVVRPKRLSGGVPQATVEYGLQTAQTVRQAVRDAAYAGPEDTYHPD